MKTLASKLATVATIVIVPTTLAWGASPTKAAAPKPQKQSPPAVAPGTVPAPLSPSRQLESVQPQAETPRSVQESTEPEPVAATDLARGYTLGVGDVVRFTVFQQQDMTTETRVSETGTITVPLVGAVQVKGLSARQAEDKIGRLLKARGFVREPQVNLTILQFKSRQVAVLGQVNRPGRYAMEEGVYRLTDALALAGGVIAGASDFVTLIRVVDEKPQRYELDIPALFKGAAGAENLIVRNGDTIYVDRAPQFYIYGEVQRPGAYRLEKDMTVMQALSVGGGLTPRGSRKDIQVSRKDASGRAANTTAQLTDLVKPDDVVYVKESLF